MAPRKITDKRAMRIVKEAMSPYLQTLAFGANLYEKGVREPFTERGHKKRDEAKCAIEHIKERLVLNENVRRRH